MPLDIPSKARFVQLPVPQINFGLQTANIPLAGACLLQALSDVGNLDASIIPESLVSYLADAALLEIISRQKPQVVCFTVYTWNIDRSIFFALRLKELYAPRIIFGGPEITPDNPKLSNIPVDIFVCGAGESVIIDLLTSAGRTSSFWINATTVRDFPKLAVPYLEIELEPWIENIVLVESQRGCPYGCRYCYYGKSLEKVMFKKISKVCKAVTWALENQVNELYLLDPSLNVRPDLKRMLLEIAELNKNGELRLISEIRADALDKDTARLMAEAGFHWVEIGLQSTNPNALKTMGRKIDLARFLSGIEFLKKYGITPAVDLILGLPGDDPAGFQSSVDFVANNGLADDIQIFPLSVLPGTSFRRHDQELGLVYDRHPPYTIQQTPGFSAHDIMACLDQAESRLGVAFYPLPDLDLSWRGSLSIDPGKAHDMKIRLAGQEYIYKLVLARHGNTADLKAIARCLTHPYQVLVNSSLSFNHLLKAITILTETNPFTPLELVFFEPENFITVAELLKCCKLHRPHYLDNDMRFLYDCPGNRAVLFTLVSTKSGLFFHGPMQRQIFWWRQARMPTNTDLDSLEALDGLLIDNHLEKSELISWQDKWSKKAYDIAEISFADLELQNRWRKLTGADDYWLELLSACYLACDPAPSGPGHTHL